MVHLIWYGQSNSIHGLSHCWCGRCAQDKKVSEKGIGKNQWANEDFALDMKQKSGSPIKGTSAFFILEHQKY